MTSTVNNSLDSYTLAQIQQRVIAAKSLQITGGEQDDDAYLSMANYTGVVAYHPAELVMTVKAGTRLTAIQQLLAAEGQAMPFPVIEDIEATIGGVYAMGGNPLLRDAMLGVKIIDGQGRVLTFGGQVMKNVAGYDVTRLLVGSQGKLAVICEVSFKVLPMAYIAKSSELEKRITTASQVKNRIETGLKKVFDPRGVFV